MNKIPLSIIIPAFNERTIISKTINRINAILSDKVLFEIIIVNNGSTDGTGEMLHKMKGIKIVDLPEKKTIAFARNAGIVKATYPLIAFLDADILISEDWGDAIDQLSYTIKNCQMIITGCKVSVSENPSFIENAWFSKFPEKISANYINSGNLITTKALCTLIGGFNECLITGEDVDFCNRAIEKNTLLMPNNKFKVYHEGYPKNIQQFFRREVWHGIGDFKSIETFFKSKVAVISVAFSSLIIGSGVLFLCQKYFLSLLIVVCLFCFNMYLVYKRFNKIDVPLFTLHILYLFARTMSFFYRKSTNRNR
ncbi:MAG: glycosyltransferase [Fibrobacter sp.]|nr:glycosyltransferase [Fibrobacter sp.]